MHTARTGDRGACTPPSRKVFGQYLRVPVLPDVNWLLPDLDELGIVVSVLRHVGRQLLRPPRGVQLRRNHVLRAGVPIAAVDEHRHLQPRHYEIGPTLAPCLSSAHLT